MLGRYPKLQLDFRWHTDHDKMRDWKQVEDWE
jgi:hypothetical protein